VDDSAIGFLLVLYTVRQHSCSYPTYVSPQDDSHAYFSTGVAKLDVLIVLTLVAPSLAPQRNMLHLR
jgi:hypothetical protein